MSVAVEKFGEFEGKTVEQFKLRSDSGVEVDIISWGVLVRDWRVPVAGGLRSVVLGFEQFDSYPKASPYFGSLAGRVANRIRNATFTLDGKTYTVAKTIGEHALHGGPAGIGRLVWDGEADSTNNAVRFTHVSPDGAMGFPGNVTFTATYTLTGNRLRLDIAARADRRTPINVVQHQYFNLGTGNDVLDHTYRISASAYTELGGPLIPTGAILPVDGTIWDFRDGRTMRDATGTPIDYDGNLVLPTDRKFEDPVAIVTGPDKALTLKLYTDQPGLQVYNSVTTDASAEGKHFGHHCGFCLEDQGLPDSVNHPHFPSIIYGPDRPYSHRVDIEIA
ncbi:MAG: galactose mutarotase [Devosia sp.]|uniref:aldose epimerase family protein n=1 Tax=Devosia sp. TaxID=1871048 RepID=UPI001AC8897A|nr:aldose epimerase family protein [Devosia sp.]MBN9315791.1 galactose mutarotase [Devosia sp.]